MADQQGGSKLWWVLGGGCGVLVLIALCTVGSCALMGGGIFAATRAPAQEAERMLSDLRAGNMSSAYGRMSQAYRASSDQAAFEQEVASIPALRAHTSASTIGVERNTAGATINFRLTTPSGSEQVSVQLVEEGEQWRVSGIRPM